MIINLQVLSQTSAYFCKDSIIEIAAVAAVENFGADCDIVDAGSVLTNDDDEDS